MRELLTLNDFYDLLKKAESSCNVKYEYDKIYDWEPNIDIDSHFELNRLYSYYKEAVKTGKDKIEPKYMHWPYVYFKFKYNKLIELKYTYDPSDYEEWTYYFTENIE